jgi:hypothetical protein
MYLCSGTNKRKTQAQIKQLNKGTYKRKTHVEIKTIEQRYTQEENRRTDKNN